MPLSPLLFAVCVDMLLRTLELCVPGTTCKAFTDDIAAVVEDWDNHALILENVFREFSEISSLALNIDKTVCIPSGLEEKMRWLPNSLSQSLHGAH